MASTAGDVTGRIEAAGGTIHLRKTPIPGIGWLAVATDTEANVFSMLQPDQSAA